MGIFRAISRLVLAVFQLGAVIWLVRSVDKQLNRWPRGLRIFVLRTLKLLGWLCFFMIFLLLGKKLLPSSTENFLDSLLFGIGFGVILIISVTLSVIFSRALNKGVEQCSKAGEAVEDKMKSAQEAANESKEAIRQGFEKTKKVIIEGTQKTVDFTQKASGQVAPLLKKGKELGMKVSETVGNYFRDLSAQWRKKRKKRPDNEG